MGRTFHPRGLTETQGCSPAVRAPWRVRRAVDRPPLPTSTSKASLDADPVPELRDRRLELPVRDSVRQELRDSFYEKRGSDRRHEAIDIMTPRNTPIVAVEDGTHCAIVRQQGRRQHRLPVRSHQQLRVLLRPPRALRRRAQRGRCVRRGQLLGYAGTSGNAPKMRLTCHFAIFRLTEKKQWWQGTPIDPYEVLR